ncbi:MAG: D-alanyl-D-alanine carboxypeptidase [Clostridia bacterium]|nr:D-alanyl-D-alanine carboxypeptidase [Clostridia bacterium]
MTASSRAEALFIRILICATVFMLAFVFTVFMLSGRNSVAKDADTSADITTAAPTVANTPSYIPVSDEQTAIFDDAKLDAEYALLMDMQTGRVVASRHADRKIYPASMTKIMTMIVCCENISDLTQKVAVSGDAIAAAYVEGASCAGFTAGERVSVLELLYGTALPSGADATGTLALYVAGSEKAFVDLMNTKAGELGLTNTHFANASGLHDDDHYTTPREMAAIVAYAMNNELCREILSATSYTTAPTAEHPQGITMYSTAFSRMSATKFGSAQIVAAKTGYTDEARFCLASYAETDSGGRYVLITAAGSDRYAPVYDCKYVYENFTE